MIRSAQFRLLKRMSWSMNGAVLALVVTGVLFVYSACYQNAKLEDLYRRQMLLAGVGLLGYLVVTVLDYRRLGDAGWALYGASVVLLILVLCAGVRINGARRWLIFFGQQIQPSEIAKLGMIVFLARLLSRPGRRLKRARHMAPVALVMAVPVLLIAMQPDLGTAIVFIPPVVVMLFVAGVPVKVLGGFILVLAMVAPLGWFGLTDNQKNRIEAFISPGKDPHGAGWSKMQSEIAIGSGGLTGKGFKAGTQNILGFLPRTVAPTDFIFSVIAEEKGFLGSLWLLLLYSVVIVACARTALSGRDMTGRLLCIGIGTLFFCHVFINISMTVGLLPVTGLPLPLISYGGSFTVICLLALGMVQSVYVRRYGR